MLPKCMWVSGYLPFKNINMPGWSKGKFALFQMPETVGGQWQAFVQRLTPSPHNQGVRAFIDRVGGGWYMQKQHSNL